MTAPARWRRPGPDPAQQSEQRERPAQQRATSSHRRNASEMPAGQSGVGRRNVFLGNTTKLPSPVITAEENERRKSRRAYRFGLRDMLSGITTVKRVGACGRCRVSTEVQPSVRVQGDEGNRVAHYAGVQLCGSIHLCPVCSPRIRQTRADDIDAAAQVWLERYGAGSVMLLTMTLPHDHGERLLDLRKTVSESFGATVAGKAWQVDKAVYGIRHYIVAHDTTHGVNGWHPHLHALVFGERALTDEAIETLTASLHRRWARAVERRGHRPPSREHGVMLERARSRFDVARYISQVVAGDADDDTKTKPVALELARGDLKTSRMPGHRTPWQILSDIGERRAADGAWTPADDAADDYDRALWREWESATVGLKAIRWSRGLRAEVGMVDEKSDEEIVNEEVGGIQLFLFSNDDDSWSIVARTRGGRGQVLRAAETGGALAVRVAVHDLVERWRKRERAAGQLGLNVRARDRRKSAAGQTPV